MTKILVIKHGALGDWLLATSPMQAIRQRWLAIDPATHFTLLTRQPFAALGQASGWFDQVVVDDCPKWHQWRGLWRLARMLNGWRLDGQASDGGQQEKRQRFDFIYDLQTSGRSGLYHRLLLPPKPSWSGIAAGASHRHNTPHRRQLHSLERLAEQMDLAGIASCPPPNLDWLRGEVADFNLPSRYALLIPGCSPHRPEKRWPAELYGQLAQALMAQGIAAVVVGTQAEAAEAAVIGQVAPDAINLVGQTSLGQLASLARRAALAIGNDTGPMHLAAIVGAPSLTLFSQASDPTRMAPRGQLASWIRQDQLQDLSVQRVLDAVGELLATQP
jgi:ADP-heptose:LPS heptosyltransferase